MKNYFSTLLDRPIGIFLVLLLTVFISKFIFLLISEIGLNYFWSINVNTLVQDIASQNFKHINALPRDKKEGLEEGDLLNAAYTGIWLASKAFNKDRDGFEDEKILS